MSNPEEPDPATGPGAPPPGKQKSGKPEANASLGLAIVLALGLLIGMAYLWQNYSGEKELPRTASLFGQMHPVIVHFPFAILLLVFLMEVLSIVKPFRGLQSNTRFLLWLATLGAAGSIIGGFLLKAGGTYTSGIMGEHMWAGFAVAAGSIAALMLKSGTGQSFLYRAVLTLTVLTVLVTTHLGASITHQPDYLSKHMPDSWAIKPYLNMENGLRGILSQLGGKVPKEKDTAAGQLVYQDYVYPVLEDKCVSCHNADKGKKPKGKLNMKDWAAFSERGEDLDPAFVAGDPDASLIMERIHLPLDDEDHMPPEDKDQLTEDEIRVITWWIAEGASNELAVANANIGDEIAAILKTMEPPDPAVLAAEAATKEKAAAEVEKKKADQQAALDVLQEKGYALRPLSAEDAGLQFNAVNVAADFDDDALSLFQAVAADIVELDLARTRISDDSASLLGSMENLTKLHLENTGITDATLARLANLDKLEYLNLYGTKVTDAGLAKLKDLDSIRKVYVWETEVTPEGGKDLEDAKPGLEVNLGWKESDITAAVAAPAAEEKEKKPAEAKKPAAKAQPEAKAKPDAKPKPAAEKPKPAAAKADEEKKPGAKGKPSDKKPGEKKSAAEKKPAANEAAPDAAKPAREKPAPKRNRPAGKDAGKEKPGADRPDADKPARKPKPGATKPAPDEKPAAAVPEPAPGDQAVAGWNPDQAPEPEAAEAEAGAGSRPSETLAVAESRGTFVFRERERRKYGRFRSAGR